MPSFFKTQVRSVVRLTDQIERLTIVTEPTPQADETILSLCAMKQSSNEGTRECKIRRQTEYKTQVE